MPDFSNVAIVLIVAIVGVGEILSQVEREENLRRVNVPILFNMEKARRDGHLDVSVLSGLVKVQREGLTNSTNRSLLRRPMQVSVLGIPIYQRGNGIFDRGPRSDGDGLFGDGGILGPNGIGGILGQNGIGGILFGNSGRGNSGGGDVDAEIPDEPVDEDPELDP